MAWSAPYIAVDRVAIAIARPVAAVAVPFLAPTAALLAPLVSLGATSLLLRSALCLELCLVYRSIFGVDGSTKR